MTLEEALSHPTLSVPEAGAVFYGLSRNGSYEAAKRGDIPTVTIGRKKRAIVAPIAEKLGLRATTNRHEGRSVDLTDADHKSTSDRAGGPK